MKPAYVINFKTYRQATGAGALRLAKICDRIAGQKKASIMLCVQPADIYLSQKVSVPVFAQHVDPAEQGQTTGFITPESVKAGGAKGTLLNHSEHKLPFEKLKKAVQLCKENNLKIILCANTPAEARKLKVLKPDYIAVEPPALIGGKRSVSEAKPEVITDTTKYVKKIPVLCGAGIHKKEDVEKSLELGAKGILVASAVVKAGNPGKKLKELIV